MFLIFRILGGQNTFFYVIGNEVDDSFDIENRAGRELIDTGRWKKKNFRFRGVGGGGKEKSFLLFVIYLFSFLIIMI